MNVLKVPPELSPTQESVLAHWKHIDLMDRDGPLISSECTLAKQVVDLLLPLFTTRNVEYASPDCKRRIGTADVSLRLDVLVSDPD